MTHTLIDMSKPRNYNSTPLPLVYAPRGSALVLGVDLKNENATPENAREAIEAKIPFFTPANAKSHEVELLHTRPYGAYLTSYIFAITFYK